MNGQSGRVRSRIARGIGANAFTHAIIAVVQLAIVPALASQWGLQLYGWWVLVSTIPSYVALGDLGFASAAGVDMTIKVAQGDRAGALKTYQNAWIMVTILSVALMIVCFSIAWLLPARYLATSTVDASTFRTVVTLLTAQSIVALQGSILLAGFRCNGMYALGTMTQAWIMLGEGLALILVVTFGGGPVLAAATLVGCRISGVAAQFVLLSVKAPWLNLRGRRVSLAEIKRLLRPSLGIICFSGAQATFLQGTTIVVGAAMSPASAAVFSSVRTLTRIGVQSTLLLNRAVAPEFSIVSARSDRSAQARIIGLTVLSSTLLLLPAAAALFALGPTLIRIWTVNTVQAPYSLIATMTAVMMLHGFWMPLANCLIAINKHAKFSQVYLGSSLAAVAAAYPLTRALDETGAAIALLVLDATMLTVVSTILLTRLCNMREIFDALRKDLSSLKAKLLRKFTF
ncbi:lipopolysaccharide biosynthesis protein [Bradyrhizobium yuanmingense]|nr:hypothetical protein [Bradyrhizobium yuanmingense]